MLFTIDLKHEEEMLLRALSQVRKIHYEGLLAVGQLIHDWHDTESLFVYLARRYYGRYFEGREEIQKRSLEMAKSTARTAPFEYTAKPMSEDTDRRQLEYAIYTLERLGLLETYQDCVKWVRITPEGDNIVDRIGDKRLLFGRKPPAERRTIFFAGAFGPGREVIDALYNDVISGECKEQEYEAIRIDLIEPAVTITDDILGRIQACKLIIADLTYARPSVYYEVGFALGLGIRLLLTCRDDHEHGHVDDCRVHFDIAQCKISYWRYNNGRFIWPNNMDPATRLKQLLVEC